MKMMEQQFLGCGECGERRLAVQIDFTRPSPNMVVFCPVCLDVAQFTIENFTGVNP